MRLFRYTLVEADDSLGTYDETVCYDYATDADAFASLSCGEGGHGGWFSYATDITEVTEIPQAWVDQQRELEAQRPYWTFVMPSPDAPFVAPDAA